MSKLYIVFALMLMSKTILGCSCVTIGGDSVFLDSDLVSAHVVFSGKVISIDSILIEDNYILGKLYEKRIIFKVDFVFKKTNKTKRKKITVITDDANNDCSYPFVMGAKYLVFALNVCRANNLKKHFLFVDRCTKTTLYSKERDELLKLKYHPKVATNTIKKP